MGEPAISRYTYEAYLALEAESEMKYEYHDGFIIAMAGGTPEHGQIAGNFIRFSGNALSAIGKSCIVYTSDVKVHLESSNRSFYPDASIVCGLPQKSSKDPHALTNPILVLEVISESTKGFDLGAKFTHYRQIPTLREYVIIRQDQALVDTYYLTDSGMWDIKTYSDLKEAVHLKSIDCQISMADIYWLVPGIHQEEGS